MNAFIGKIRIDPTGLSIGACNSLPDGSRISPQSDLPRSGESRVFDLEQLSAVVENAKPVAFELHTQPKPLIGWDRNRDSVASLPADDVKWAAHAFDGLVEHDIVLECIGTDHVVVVRISSPPDDSARAILGAGNGLELYLNEPIL